MKKLSKRDGHKNRWTDWKIFFKFEPHEFYIIGWGLVLMLVFLAWSLEYEHRSAFKSTFMMNMAFSFFGGIVVAVVLNLLLKAREEERWATFDEVTLRHLKGRLERFIDVCMMLVVSTTDQNESLPILPDRDLKYNEDKDVETVLRAMSERCYTKHQSTLGSLVIERQSNIRRHLSLLSSALTFLAQSPFMPKALSSKVQLMYVWSEELIYRLEMPVGDKTNHANNISKAFFELTECVWDVYDLTSEALHAKQYR